MRIHRQVTETLVYGSHITHRYTQDSPILADVWIRYGEEPLEWQDLLLSPQWGFEAGHVSVVLRSHVEQARHDPGAGYAWWRATTRCPAHVAYNQVYTAARLYFDEVMRVVLPMTLWWNDLWRQTIARWRHTAEGQQADGVTTDRVLRDLAPELELALDGLGRPGHDTENISDETREQREAISNLPADLPWFIRVVGVIARAVERSIEERAERTGGPDCDDDPDSTTRRNMRAEATDWIESFDGPWYWDNGDPDRFGDHKGLDPFASINLIEAARDVLGGIDISGLEHHTGLPPHDPSRPDDMEGHVHLVNLNRKASTAVGKSRLTVKADAAERLFDIDTSAITWGIIDTGIDATHPAFFRTPENGEAGPALTDHGAVADGEWVKWTRVQKTYDFTRIRVLLDPVRLANAEELDGHIQAVIERNPDEFEDLQRSLLRGRNVDWDLLEPFLLVPHDPETYLVPQNGHGTHVAGIIAANWEEQNIVGVCKDINLYDLRVLEPGKPNDEFAVLAALQFVQWLNAQKDFFAVHGVNLSMSIRHEVANYACGRTPVCDQCEDLIGSGVTVVAAAGNAGYLRYRTATGPADAHEDTTEGYHTVSITDPGNATGVITVGATHREKPHDYGVSYFSSRGPTGDGRQKPDLVAPGEKINSVFPGGSFRPLDGTSMAAPHVSGAAAMLMARHSEFIGQPARIKHALCSTATDLGREKYFQGAGLVDVLRALQSI